MKKVLGLGILASVLLISSSFATISPISTEASAQKSHKKKIIAVSFQVPIPLTVVGCVVTVSETIFIDIDSHPPKVTGYSVPTFSWSCRRGIVDGTLESIDLDADGHLTDIKFGTTGDLDTDAALSDPKNIALIKSDFDQDVDAQKN